MWVVQVMLLLVSGMAAGCTGFSVGVSTVCVAQVMLPLAAAFNCVESRADVPHSRARNTLTLMSGDMVVLKS